MSGDRRVMRGQVAAVCALAIAGVTYGDAVRIVGSGRLTMRAYVPRSYRPRGRHKIPIWQRDGARKLYEGTRLKLEAVAQDAGLSMGTIYKLAKAEGWKRRGPIRQPASYYESHSRTDTETVRGGAGSTLGTVSPSSTFVAARLASES